MNQEQDINQNLPTEIHFHYIKSNLFRVAHIDGVHGGLTPQPGRLQMALFSERRPIPQHTFNKVVDGQLGDEISEKRIQKDGIIREVEVECIIPIKVAESIKEWLENMIKEHRRLEALIESANSKKK